jgi:hypothetical protein
MKSQALHYYMHDEPTAFRFELVGLLDRDGARRLDQDWKTASSTTGDGSPIIDITFVTGVDEEGQALIARWHRGGARLIANSASSRALAESILGVPLPEPPADADATGPEYRWFSFRSSLFTRAAALVLLAMIACPVGAATLKSETVAAWNAYVETANANLQDRVRPGGSFLWSLESRERAAKVRAGEIVVAPAPGENPKKVPGGLIHHWIGAVFVPNLKLDDILEVTRDYDHYKQYYRPSVVDSKTIARTGHEDKFSMLLMNKAFFLKSALDADYEATNVRFDDGRFYSVSTTTRIREVEEFGQPGEHRKPEGEGSGYIWRLHSFARIEQRDDGVYLELEAIALSRDVPAAMRFVVDPIVRRVSRNSLLISLQQTEEAAGSKSANVASGTRVPASGEQLRGLPALLPSRGSEFTDAH